MTKPDCFSVLNVAQDATPEEARRAYLQLVRRWHPDQYRDNPDLRNAAQEKLKIINAAYQEAKRITSAREKPVERQTPAAERQKTFFEVVGSMLTGCFGNLFKPRPRGPAAYESKNREKGKGQRRAGGKKNEFETILSNAMHARGGAAQARQRKPALRSFGRNPSAQGGRPLPTGKKRGDRITPITKIKRVGKVR